MLPMGLPKLRMVQFTILKHLAPMVSLRSRKGSADPANRIARWLDCPGGKEAQQHNG